ncbi:DNA adenine methylase [Halorussus salinus]|uniref:DNA adenine methylase n=1 Tax=Halorussus salinus TaxID=1364935 RepID=UPI001091EBB8|nr:DNA adenine methylase [Halorussus salinus]
MFQQVPTQRDRIWDAALRLLEFERTFRSTDVQEAIDGEPPAERTVRNTLDAMEELGLLSSKGGAGRAPRVFHPRKPGVADSPGGYSPQQSSHSGTFPYPGGKGSIAEWVIETMPAHDTYVEVFGGAAGVLYNKPRSKYEIYNDHNEDVTQFFRVLRDRPGELAEWLQAVPYSRAQYEEWVTEFYDGIRPDDPIERAGRFFSLRYMQYVGESSSPNGFKARAKRSPARTFDNARQRIQTLAQRFGQVTIENQDYQAILENYDDSAVDVLFYCDPPYLGAEDVYGEEFNHQKFAECLREVENDWMVSYSEVPNALQSYTIVERESRHRMRRSSPGVNERLICNFAPE